MFSLSGCTPFWLLAPCCLRLYPVRSPSQLKKILQRQQSLPFTPFTQLIAAAVAASISRVNWSSV